MELEQLSNEEAVENTLLSNKVKRGRLATFVQIVLQQIERDFQSIQNGP